MTPGGMGLDELSPHDRPDCPCCGGVHIQMARRDRSRMLLRCMQCGGWFSIGEPVDEITMDTRFSHLLTLGKDGVQRRFSELIDELKFLCASFPDLDDAFDGDDLPLSFIITRDAEGAAVEVVRRGKSGPPGAATTVASQARSARRKAPARAD